MNSASSVFVGMINRQVENYSRTLVALEDAFNKYEAGWISITAYLETVCEVAQTFRRQRPLWLWLFDWSLVLRGVNSAERRAFDETLAALNWCREWAIQQRGADVVACLATAGTTASHDLGELVGAAV